MNNFQEDLEKKLRKLLASELKSMDTEQLLEALPKFHEWFKRIIDQPTHSQWYIEELESEIEKTLRNIKKPKPLPGIPETGIEVILPPKEKEKKKKIVKRRGKLR